MALETDSSAVVALLDKFSDDIDNVEANLSMLLEKPLSTSNGRLPLLDKAKVSIHTAYAIESLLFSHLRLAGVETKSHNIISELNRVRSYFEKIKSTEAVGPSARLDKEAANRFIKHALAGQNEHGRKEEMSPKGLDTGGKRKLDELAQRYGKHSRFESANKRARDKGSQPEDSAATEQGGAGKVALPEAQSKKEKKYDTSSRHRKKHSHAPKDAHQAFQSLLSRNADTKAP